jgi:hypothetical protein
VAVLEDDLHRRAQNDKGGFGRSYSAASSYTLNTHAFEQALYEPYE